MHTLHALLVFALQIKADFLELSKSKHGRHLVQKLISQAKKEEVPGTESQLTCTRAQIANLHANIK